MAALAQAVQHAVHGEDLTAEEMTAAVGEVLSGDGEPALIAALAVALRMKGETSAELLGAARAMRAHCTRVDLSELDVVTDTCGTGGDGRGTFNVSTASAFVVAACGVPVAKHGNRAVSSKTGSADVLEALGLRLDGSPENVAASVRQLGLGFLFAPQHHQALRFAAPVRKALGLRTFFNLLGPLSNPAFATHQLVGVYAPDKLELVAGALRDLGVRGAWVVHGAGGLDEISPLGKTDVVALHEGTLKRFEVHPSDFGYPERGDDALAGGEPEENANRILDILGGAPGPQREVVVMNAAAVLVLSGAETDLRASAARCGEALDSGRALSILERLRAASGGPS